MTTIGFDVNEVQTVQAVGTVVNEVQLVQTFTTDAPEVQVVEISTPRVNEVQVIGVILEGINIPNSCTINHECAAVESLITGSFTLKFDPSQCGLESTVTDSNWCISALTDMGYQQADYSCSTVGSCTTGSLPAVGDGSYIQSKLCAMTGGSSKKLMVDGNDICGVSVRKWAMALTDGANGVYLLAYNITFQVAHRHSVVVWGSSHVCMRIRVKIASLFDCE